MPSTFLAGRNPILFGRGVSAEAGKKLRELGCTRVIVIFDAGVQAAGIVDRILPHIHAEGIETVLYGGVLPDPPDYTVEEAAALGRAAGVDGVVAIGGGSALDTGKGVKVLLTNPPPLKNYYLAHEDVQPPDAAMRPIVVIPTTAGTGSECTPGGVITDTEKGCKQNVPCAANLGIVDPELTLSLPPSVTAATAVDALCHAVEAYTSREENAVSRVLALEAIALIGQHLIPAVEDGANMDAREGLALAATLAGMAIMGPFCNVPHEIGLPLGMIFHIPHGTACGATLPEAMAFLAPVIPEKVATVARLMGAEVPEGAEPEAVGGIARSHLRAVYEKIGMPRLSQFVPSREALTAAVPRIMAESPFVFSPRTVTAADVEEILRRAYEAE